MCFQNGPKFQKLKKRLKNEHNPSIMLEDKIIALIMLEILGLCSDYAGII